MYMTKSFPLSALLKRILAFKWHIREMIIAWQSIDHFPKDRLLRDDQSKQEQKGGKSIC